MFEIKELSLFEKEGLIVNILSDIRFNAVPVKNTIFLDVMPRSPATFNRHFEGTYCLFSLMSRIKSGKKSLRNGWQRVFYQTTVYCVPQDSNMKMFCAN
jgi:hypothetical protein